MPTSSECRAVVQRGADGRWFARPYMGTDRVTGRRIRPYRSWDAELTREQAQAECDSWVATFAPSSARDSSKRLSSMLETYISDPVNGLSDNSVATYRSAVRTMVEPTIGRLPYDQLEPWDVSAAYRMLLAPRTGKGLSPKTLLKMHALLKGAYRSWRPALGRDIMLDVPAPSTAPSEPFALSECDVDELSRVLASAMTSRSATGANITRRTEAMAAYLALNTGMRVGEVCGLQRRDWRRALHDLHVAGQAVEKPELHRQAYTKGRRAQRGAGAGRRGPARAPPGMAGHVARAEGPGGARGDVQPRRRPRAALDCHPAVQGARAGPRAARGDGVPLAAPHARHVAAHARLRHEDHTGAPGARRRQNDARDLRLGHAGP